MKSSLFLLLIAGCAAPKYTIHFESEPAGARVFYGQGADERSVTESYVGSTPCVLELEGEGNRRFKVKQGVMIYSTFVPAAIVFRAEPGTNSAGLFPQRAVYHAGNIVKGADAIPEKIFFDMRKP